MLKELLVLLEIFEIILVFDVLESILGVLSVEGEGEVPSYF